MVLEKALESPLDYKEIQPVHPKEQSWVFIGKTDAEADSPILWLPHEKSWLIGKDSDAGRIGGRRRRGWQGWDGWIASLTQWTWVWVNSRSWWWTGRPGVLRFMGSQRVGHYWATELNWYRYFPKHLMNVYEVGRTCHFIPVLRTMKLSIKRLNNQYEILNQKNTQDFLFPF